MPPKGAWKPSLNICTVLASIGLLLSEPNADDGLMTDVTTEYKHDRAAFDAKAKQMTKLQATQKLPLEDVPLSSGPGQDTRGDGQLSSDNDSSSSDDEEDDSCKKQRLS
mmetsp:Transcript_32498/g.92100  ORF Transcript_32498/g.92100 Transcript_32498/m.92100 type:complete len:109 (+) Transcript_32498:870-1196(+)